MSPDYSNWEGNKIFFSISVLLIYYINKEKNKYHKIFILIIVLSLYIDYISQSEVCFKLWNIVYIDYISQSEVSLRLRNIVYIDYISQSEVCLRLGNIFYIDDFSQSLVSLT